MFFPSFYLLQNIFWFGRINTECYMCFFCLTYLLSFNISFQMFDRRNFTGYFLKMHGEKSETIDETDKWKYPENIRNEANPLPKEKKKKKKQDIESNIIWNSVWDINIKKRIFFLNFCHFVAVEGKKWFLRNLEIFRFFFRLTFLFWS